MVKRFAQSDTKIGEYAEQTFHPEDEILIEIRKRCEAAGLPRIQVGPLDGLHLEVLTRAAGAKKTVEIGTLGGYSGVCLLRGMGQGGKLYTLEISHKHAEVAKESFQLAGFESNADVLVGPALENLEKLNQHGPFDLVFIDADKKGYAKYIDWAAENLRVGGVVLADNTFAFGYIAEENVPEEDRSSVEALREFNQKVAQDKRFRSTILPTGEGLTMAVKIS